MSVLTDSKIRADIDPDNTRKRPFKRFDRDGLFILVPRSGRAKWRFRYQLGGREKILTIGTYPVVSLKKARDKRDEWKEMLSEGRDPGAERSARKAALLSDSPTAFGKIAKQWHDLNAGRWTASYSAQVWRRVEADLIGLWTRPIEDIRTPELLEELRKVEARGVLETTRRLRIYAEAIFKYAIAVGHCENNPAANLRGALKPPAPPVHHKALPPAQMGVLLNKLDEYDGEPTTPLALRLALLTVARTNEVRGATWDEFNHLENPRAALWRIPKERMKARADHVVPLSHQAVSLLKDLRKLTGGSDYLFPGAKSGVISQNTLIYAYYRMGYRTRATTHGQRSTFSHWANENRENEDVIELCLHHAPRNKTRAAYARLELVNDRRVLLQKWADTLDHWKAHYAIL